jgi:predicted nucleic acid-binding protein
VLADKFGWEPPMAEAAVAQVARIASVARPGRTLAVIDADPADDRVLEAAIEGRADVIVSGDRHLLQLRAWEGVRIVRAAAFLDELQPQGRS